MFKDRLTRQESRVYEAIKRAGREGRVATTEELYRSVSNNPEPQNFEAMSNNVGVLVSRMGDKILPDEVVSVPGIGYYSKLATGPNANR